MPNYNTLVAIVIAVSQQSGQTRVTSFAPPTFLWARFQPEGTSFDAATGLWVSYATWVFRDETYIRSQLRLTQEGSNRQLPGSISQVGTGHLWVVDQTQMYWANLGWIPGAARLSEIAIQTNNYFVYDEAIAPNPITDKNSARYINFHPDA